MLETREMKMRDKIYSSAFDSFSFSHPLHDPFGAIILIARNVQSCIELKNDFPIPRVLKLKDLHQAEIIKVLQQLIETTNSSHSRNIKIFVRENLLAFIEDPRIIDCLFFGPETRRFRSARPIIRTSLKELGMRIPIEKRSFCASTSREQRQFFTRIWILEFFFGSNDFISIYNRIRM